MQRSAQGHADGQTGRCEHCDERSRVDAQYADDDNDQKERQRDVDHARKEASQRGVYFTAGHHVAHRPADPADDPAADGQQNQRDENAQAEVDDVFDQHADQVLGRHVRQHVEFLLDNGFFRRVRDGLGRGDQL